MPKLTVTGYEIGSSEAGAIVLHRTAFQTRHDVLRRHKLARSNVEQIEDNRFEKARLRGNMLEPGVANWAEHELKERSGGGVMMFEPDTSYRKPDLGIASSIDRIISVEKPFTLKGVDEEVEVKGTGILEIKTDAYHEGKPKPEWIIQVLHQMLCSDYRWGVIACMDQKLQLSLYPVAWNGTLIDAMVEAYAEFWELAKSDGEYPPIAETNQTIAKLDDHLTETSGDLRSICTDYLAAKAKAKEYLEIAEDCKAALQDVLDSLEVEYGRVSGFEIRNKKTWRERKQLVGTGEFYETETFSVKGYDND